MSSPTSTPSFSPRRPARSTSKFTTRRLLFVAVHPAQTPYKPLVLLSTSPHLAKKLHRLPLIPHLRAPSLARHIHQALTPFRMRFCSAAFSCAHIRALDATRRARAPFVLLASSCLSFRRCLCACFLSVACMQERGHFCIGTQYSAARVCGRRRHARA